MDDKKLYEEWLTSPVFDEATKAELKAIAGNDAEIRDRFYKDLEFGTGGLRGVVGAGTNRMNLYTVRRATQGLAKYILNKGAEAKGVAISFDSRHFSPEFAEAAALTLNANGIKAYVFDALRPTPELSYAVRELGCTAGIMVTASHNPPEYNGYKVYWDDGCQITAPVDKDIIDLVKDTAYSDIKTMDKEEAVKAGLFNVIGSEMDDKYVAELKKLILSPEIIKKQAENLKIVYTPFHGTGNVPVQRMLKELGFKEVYIVKEQEEPDGDFTTLDYPNPEDEKAFELALKLAKEKDADIVLANDPDADRLGVYAKDKKTGKYIQFTGNMSGMLLAEYELSVKKDKGLLKDDSTLITTIVSTNLAFKIAEYYNLDLIEVLTGFKFIGEKIKGFEEKGRGTYEFGFEESYGCLIGTHARDKDGIMAVVGLCEAAAYYMDKGLTLWDQMLNMYEKYGYFKEGIYTMTLAGEDGAKRINEILDNLRKNPPTELAGYKVLKTRDYANDVVKDLTTGETGTTGLPKSNVLYFDMTSDAWFCVRPSGTEPKIKFYAGIKGNSLEDAEDKLNKVLAELKKLGD
ncbi:MAG: phospho-sugar mutase [Catonella sp.]|uniref:phospho-sugar mutase n=1 Tax=Catonella sp. TaxID=2382125 RepID=UPI003F9F3300